MSQDFPPNPSPEQFPQQNPANPQAQTPQVMNPHNFGQQQQNAAGAQLQQFAKAQGALKSGNTIMTVAKWGMVAFGAVIILAGLATMIFGSLFAGLPMLFVGGVLIGTAFLFLPQFEKMMGQATQMVNEQTANAQLAQTGIPATAVVQSVQQTGTMVNYNPECVVVLQVTHPNTGAQYPVQTKAVIPQMNIPQVQPGAQVQVRIHPHDPTSVALAF